SRAYSSFASGLTLPSEARRRWSRSSFISSSWESSPSPGSAPASSRRRRRASASAASVASSTSIAAARSAASAAARRSSASRDPLGQGTAARLQLQQHRLGRLARVPQLAPLRVVAEAFARDRQLGRLEQPLLLDERRLGPNLADDDAEVPEPGRTCTLQQPQP